MPTADDSSPLSLRLENDQIEYLKMLAKSKSTASGRKVTYADLAREALTALYPVPDEFRRARETDRIWWAQVYTGIERLALSGTDTCVISSGGSRYPIGHPHLILQVGHVKAAASYGLFVHPIPVDLGSPDGRTQESEYHILLSKKEKLSIEEIRSFVPEYTGNS